MVTALGNETIGQPVVAGQGGSADREFHLGVRHVG